MILNKLSATLILFSRNKSIEYSLYYERQKMTDKLYNVAGIATDCKGNTKVRYANNLQTRTKVLLKNNFTNVKLIQLDDRYEKYEIAQILLNMTDFSQYVDIIAEEVDKINRVEQQCSIKLQKRQRKLALANITAEDILEAIK